MTETMKCASCGEAVLSTDKFCKQCGQPNEQKTEQTIETVVAAEISNKKEKFKLYSLWSVVAATILGTPLAAGILVRKNFLNLGRKKEGVIALIIGIITTIILIVLPIEDTALLSLIPFINGGITYLIVKKMYGKILKTHKEEGGEFYSHGKAVGIALICGVIAIVGIFAYYYFTDKDSDFNIFNSNPEEFNGYNSYGKSKTFNGTEVFYTSSIILDEVNSLGRYLINSEFADGEKKPYS